MNPSEVDIEGKFPCGAFESRDGDGPIYGYIEDYTSMCMYIRHGIYIYINA